MSWWLLVALCLLGPATAGSAGLAARALYGSRAIRVVQLSPSGSWAVALVIRGNLHGLLAQRLGSRRIDPLLAVDVPILDFHWVGRDRLLVDFGASFPNLVARIRQGESGVVIEKEWIRVNSRSYLVDPLPLDDEAVLWAFPTPRRSTLHRVTLEELIQHPGDSSLAGDTLARIPAWVEDWIVDRRGAPRVALVRDEDELAIFTESGLFGSFREVYRFEPERDGRDVLPMGMSTDGRRVIAAAYAGHDTVGLHEFDPVDGTLGVEVFRRPDLDVMDAVFDDFDGSLVAAIVEEEGEQRYVYLDERVEGLLDSLHSRHPKEEVRVVSRSADRRVQVLSVSGPTNPGVYYLGDAGTGEVIEIGRLASHLTEEQLAPIETLSVTQSDGSRIEAFLALPKSVPSDGAPLVVMPHGGPFGVRDSKQFDPLVQYLASWGFSTLQVNYRGSGGYGRSFIQRGRREWARGIEDDIDSAVELAMARPEIDAERLCIVGGSYGGFSALIGVLRHPARYRCAVTINGVTDVPMMYQTSDFADSEQALEFYAEYVGDPERERDRLIRISPVYQVDRIQTPILVIQGTEDRRVDPDHAHRLLLMLETFGKEHEVLLIEGAGHSPDRAEAIIEARALRRFLTKHLFPGQEVEPDPEWEDDAGFQLLPVVDR